MRSPFKKILSEIEIEKAHHGSGARQLILSSNDAVSSHFKEMTKGFLLPGGIFEWHKHDGIDEFFFVFHGTGVIRFRNGTEMTYEPEQLIYIPSNYEHQIENNGAEENQFLFIRISE